MASPSRADRGAWANAAYDVAWRILHDRDTATAAAIHGLNVEAIADPASAVLVATRRRALELLADRPGGRPASDESTGVAFVHAVDDTADAIRQADQAWGAAEAMGPTEASLIDLHLRFGVPARVLADELDTDSDDADALLARLRGRLEGALATWRLWNDGKPRCEALEVVLAEVDTGDFGPESGRSIAKHAVACDTCRAAMTETAADSLEAFVDAPVLRAPAAVRAAAPSSPSSSVFIDAPAATDAGEPDRGSETTPRAAAAPAARAAAGHDSVDLGGPGLLAGIVVGFVLAVIVIAAVTAWAISSA